MRIPLQSAAISPFASSVTRAALLVLLSVSAAGCTSINGMQDSVADTGLGKSACPTGPQLDAAPAAGAGVGPYRDRVVLECVKAIDRNYRNFKFALHKESGWGQVVPDIVNLGLSGGAALTSGGTAKAFTQGALFAAGVGTTISKDVFYQQTMPAIEASMDAKRDKLLKSIIDAMKDDPDAKRYTLLMAGYDLDAYEGAGNIYAAVSELTKTAVKDAEVAKKELSASLQQQTYPIRDLPADINTRLDKLIAWVWDQKDQKVLDAVESKLKVSSIAEEAIEDEQGRLVNAIEAAANAPGDGKANMNAIEKALDGIYKP